MTRLLIFMSILAFSACSSNSNSLSSEAFQTSMLQDNTLILDIYRPSTGRSEMIEGATVVNVEDGPSRKALKDLDKSKAILLYCSNGKGSTKMTSSFKDWGFENVNTLAGGLEEWKKSGYEVVQMN